MQQRSSEMSADDEDACSQGNTEDVALEQVPRPDGMSLATGWVHVNSRDSELTESTARHENAAESALIRTTDKSSAQPEEVETVTSESNRVQQVELQVAEGVTGDHFTVPPGPENGAHSAGHAQEGEQAAEDNDQDSSQSCDATTPTKASDADTAKGYDEELDEYEEDNGDLLKSSSMLPVHLYSSPTGVSEAGAFIDSIGRVIELPVVDLELAAQGSRLRKERMRLEARAASPASRGAV